MRFILKHTNGTTTDLVSAIAHRAVTSATQNCTLNGEDTVTIAVTTAQPLNISIGDTINIYNKTYTLNEIPSITKNGSRSYNYTLKFEGPQYQLIDATFLLPDDTIRESYTGTLSEFAQFIVDNGNRLHPGEWKLGSVDGGTDYKTLTYQDQNTLTVLQDICTQWEVEFEITESDGVKTLTIGTAGQIFPYDFKYGATGGIYELTRDKSDSESLITRLYAYGPSTNISTKYQQTRYTQRLCLPNKTKNQSYIEDSTKVEQYGIHEAVYTNDEIYPKYEGTVTELGDNEYTFIDSAFPFDLNETDDDGNTKWLISGTSAKITFQTGNLAGYQFEVHQYQHSTKTMVIVPYQDENYLTLPNPDSTAFQIAVGDKYIITDIYLPDAFVEAAERQLQSKAQEYYYKYNNPQAKYTLSIDQQFLKQFGSSLAVANLFAVGDYISVTDEQLDLDGNLRIATFERNLLKAYEYNITLSEIITATTITRMVQNLDRVNQIVYKNDLDNAARISRNWKTTQEVLNSVFDPDGNYFTEKIKPLSIETTMLSVGAKSQQFVLRDITIKPNDNGSANSVKTTSGYLDHYGLEESMKTWTIASTEYTLEDSGAYYIYAKCSKTATTGSIYISQEKKTANGDNQDYYFLIGVLSSIDTATATRQIALTFGSTTINGRWVQTGRISSNDGSCYFDLDKNEIKGHITFISSTGTETSSETIVSNTASMKDYIEGDLQDTLDGLQSQIDGQIDQWFYNVDPTLTNEPASEWTTEALKKDHLGDLYYNTESGKVWRFIVTDGTTYSWSQLADEDLALALKTAKDAQNLAKTKRRVFTAEPYTPYEIGDIWLTDDGVKRCTTARATGTYTATDWEDAHDYVSKSSWDAYKSSTATTITALQATLDGKIESWYQTTQPVFEVPAEHVGDLWYKTSTGDLYRYNSPTPGIYGWYQVVDVATINQAAEDADEALKLSKTKSTTFVVTPTPPYYIGDLWLTGGAEDGTLQRCIKSRTSTESYNPNDWVEAVFYDNTRTEIDGGLVTTGSIVLIGADGAQKAGMTGDASGDADNADDDIRIWAGAEKADRATAPFRVDQAGNLVATNADLSGKITATSGQIANLNISNNHIGIGDDETGGISIYNNKLRFTTSEKLAQIGTANEPGTFTTSRQSTSLQNTAIYASATGSTAGNFAMRAVGDVSTNGLVTGTKYSTYAVTHIEKTDNLDLTNDFQDKVIFNYNMRTYGSPCYLYLPRRTEVHKHISTTGDAAVRMTIVIQRNKYSVSTDNGVRLAFNSDYQTGEIVGDPGNIMSGVIDLLIIYNEDSATAYVTNYFKYE